MGQGADGGGSGSFAAPSSQGIKAAAPCPISVCVKNMTFLCYVFAVVKNFGFFVSAPKGGVAVK